jgi:hypothetical protein
MLVERGGTGQPGRQPKEKADGVTPAGFFSAKSNN